MKCSPMRLRRARDLAAHAGDARAARVLVVDGEVIVDVAELRVGPPLPPAHADRLHRMRAQHPVGDVDVVDVLLDDVVAREPGEVQPVADLPLARRVHSGCRSRAHSPPWFQNTWPLTHVADRAVVKSLDRRHGTRPDGGAACRRRSRGPFRGGARRPRSPSGRPPDRPPLASR